MTNNNIVIEVPSAQIEFKTFAPTSTVTKSKDRTKITGEVFTPQELVNEMLDKLPHDSWLPGKTVLDNSCGNGSFLSQAFIRKLEHSDNPLPDIYGVDLMADNTSDTVARLACLQHLGVDIIDESAQFKPSITHPPYADNHDRAWLEINHTDFARRYYGTVDEVEVDITITFEYFDDGDAGVFRYTFDELGISEVNPNIVCQDALTYNYSFSKKRKKVLVF